MSKKSKLWLILGIFFTILLSGCKCSNAGVEAFEVFADLPIGGELVNSLTPLFDWHGSDSCDPDQYSLYISEDLLYGPADTAHAEVDYDDVPYTLAGDSLLPGRAYYWTARAMNLYESSEDPGAVGPDSEKAYFFTGPVCSGSPLIAPELEYPFDPGSIGKFDNWITHDNLQDFHWTYKGGCLPISYDYQFALDAGFTAIVLSGTTTEQYEQHIFESFPNCSSLFWRVRANDGTSVGPWSDALQFHWVREGTDCYQTHYLSDDAARIDVQLYWDDCSQTGYFTSISITDPGCRADHISPMIVADGERSPSSDYGMGGFEVDLGSGPCPSTGLDHKEQHELPFNVLAPGTYCVSITLDQTIDSYPNANLMSGIWSEPRTNEVVANKTVEVGPGISDILVEFGWDEYDRVIVIPKFEFTISCVFCLDPMGPVAGFLFAGQPVTIYGRDWESNWKLSDVEGNACYALISDTMIDKALEDFDGVVFRSADLEQYPPALPCPEKEQIRACSSYNDQSSCENADCTWTESRVTAGGTCSTK